MKIIVIKVMTIVLLALSACQGAVPSTEAKKIVPHQDEWGIYELNLATEEVSLIYSSPDQIYASALRLNGAGDKLVFAQKTGGTNDTAMEIYSIRTDGNDLTRLTDNNYFDLYPAWSPDGSRVAFLSWRDKDLDIFVMDADGSDVKKLYDSGSHDADIDWADTGIVFTSQFAIWKMQADGTQPLQLTNPPERGKWGKANLPAGDYDPRLSADGKRLVFERLEDTIQPNGGYNLFVINFDGSGETRLTSNNFSQGLASWSHSGGKLVYGVAAINGVGKYHIYMMNSDGTGSRDITPAYFPAGFLNHSPIFSKDDSRIYFIGQWWK